MSFVVKFILILYDFVSKYTRMGSFFKYVWSGDVISILYILFVESFCPESIKTYMKRPFQSHDMAYLC